MIIGNFTYLRGQDTYVGELSTLTGEARKLVFQPSEGKSDKAPNYRVSFPGNAGDVEVGAAWKKVSDDQVEYLSVKLDDPTLAQPVQCALLASTDNKGFILVWSRDSRKAKAA